MATTKNIGIQATNIFNKIIKLAQSNKHNCINIDTTDGTFMPLSVEKIFTDALGEHWSFTHYGEQNGDLMRDPEVIFILQKETGRVIPSYFRSDYLGKENYYVWLENGKPYFHPQPQKDLTQFCNDWLIQINQQQDLSKVELQQKMVLN